MLVESAALGLLGGVGGLLLAAWLVRILRSLDGLALPRHETIGVDATVLAFTLALALLTPLVFGLLPALQASRTDLREALAEGGRAAAPPRARIRTVLVAGEVAIALVLLVGSALLARSFARVTSVDPGVRSARRGDRRHGGADCQVRLAGGRRRSSTPRWLNGYAPSRG